METELNNQSPETNGNNKKNKATLFTVIVFVLFLVGFVTWYYFAKVNFADNNSANNNTSYNQQDNNSGLPWTFNLVKKAFASNAADILSFTPTLNFGAPKFNDLGNVDSFINDGGVSFSNTQKATLESTGFFLSDNNIVGQTPFRDDFVDMYDNFKGGSMYDRKGENAIFISSDFALHLYHVLIDRTFQAVEEKKFQPSLRSMTKALFLDSIKNYNQTTDPALKDSYKRLSAYYLVPLVVLDTGSDSAQVNLKPEDFDSFAQYLEAVDKQTIASSESKLNFSLENKMYDGQVLSDDIYDLASQELALINKASGFDKSPIFSPLRPEFINDYSQFKPRSHYTKNDVLKSYFIAMMWYGRMGFTLNSLDLTRDALIITAQINNLKVNDVSVSNIWSEMSDTIDFFVGDVDDLTAYHYTNEINKIYQGNLSLEQLANDDTINNFIISAKKDLPAPKIVSEVLDVYDDLDRREEMLNDIKQFRFMGQRFTPDAYIINNLTQGEGLPDSETGQKLPTMPTALMPLKVLAPQNPVVGKNLNDWIEDPARVAQQGRESDKIIAKVLGRLVPEFSAYDNSVWNQNIYWSWLDIFRSLLRNYGEGYPYFMQNESWQTKNMSTSLGSYTELKHDTLLYAKQSYAELGGGPGPDQEVPPVVKGYVEPDLDFWNKIINLAELSRQGLTDRNILPEEYSYKLNKLIENMKFFRTISQAELSNQQISDDDFEKLRTSIVSLRIVVDPVGGEELTDKDKRAGIIADIHTDAINGQILYEATGKPYIIYVAVNDENGPRLTRGVVYKHYEFTDSIEERLSDEDWQSKIYLGNGSIPPVDKWYSQLIK